MPQIALIGLLIVLLSGVGSYWKGRVDGYKAAEGDEAAEQKLVREIAEKAQAAAASEIAKIEIRQTTIRQVIERQIHERPIYRDAACQHAPDVLRGINAALADTVLAVAVGGGELPGADAAGGSVLRRDHAQADRSRRPVSPLPGSSPGAAEVRGDR